MKLLAMMILVAVSTPLFGFEKILKAKNKEELRLAESRYIELGQLTEKCEIYKRKKLFLWPCFMTEKKDWDERAMNSHCERQIPMLEDKSLIPPSKYALHLTSACQSHLKAQIRVLDYKAKGP